MNLGPYELNQIYAGDAKELLAELPESCIDLTVTSPPYDLVAPDENGNLITYPSKGLRDYQGYDWNFVSMARQLYRVTKQGGVVVWVIGDATINGSETGTSFRQSLYFMELGFNLHDTMIYQKTGFRYPFPNRYHQVFEYMFVFSKGTLQTFNPICDRKNYHTSRRRTEKKREADGSASYRKPFQARNFGKRYNVWEYQPSEGRVDFDDHPAIFPEALARDHILSWSTPGDVILDPMCGSGTTLKMAMQLGRNYLGFDISPEYVELAKLRVAQAQPPLFVL